MLLIPAIDIKNGACVRLRQGNMDQDVTVFDADPVAVARRWIDVGADRIHVVDLDGAKAGRPVNDKIIGDIVDAAGSIPVQVGGGIRDEAAIETYIERGVEYVILGTRAVSEPHFVSDVGVSFPAISSWVWTPRTARWPPTAGPSSRTTTSPIWPSSTRPTAWSPSSIPTSAATA